MRDVALTFDRLRAGNHRPDRGTQGHHRQQQPRVLRDEEAEGCAAERSQVGCLATSGDNTNFRFYVSLFSVNCGARRTRCSSRSVHCERMSENASKHFAPLLERFVSCLLLCVVRVVTVQAMCCGAGGAQRHRQHSEGAAVLPRQPQACRHRERLLRNAHRKLRSRENLLHGSRSDGGRKASENRRIKTRKSGNDM